jgi:RNA-directed DNA polymerase
MPEDVARRFCQQHGYGHYDELDAKHRTSLLNLSEAEIVLTYNAEMRGLANYYNLAIDMKHRLAKLYFIWQTSLFKTIANKRRLNVEKVANMLRQDNGEHVLHVTGQKDTREVKVFKLKHIDRKKSVVVDSKPVTARITTRTTDLILRLEARMCEYCGEEGPCEVHHVRKLKDLSKGRESGHTPSLWQLMMIARKRKTIVLCQNCHHQLHAGTLPDLRQVQRNDTSLTSWRKFTGLQEDSIC